jgi:hypothetical protein
VQAGLQSDGGARALMRRQITTRPSGLRVCDHWPARLPDLPFPPIFSWVRLQVSHMHDDGYVTVSCWSRGPCWSSWAKVQTCCDALQTPHWYPDLSSNPLTDRHLSIEASDSGETGAWLVPSDW